VAAEKALARAKLNLYLHITGRRADGYHLLDSLVAFVALGDGLRARTADSLSLGIVGPFAAALQAEPDNLVLRAARALRQTVGIGVGAAIELDKRLPVASGIGGGSADAAAALVILQRLWRLDLDRATLDRLALSLGADVPVCLHGQASFVGGIGGELAPAPTLPPAGLVLVNAGVPLATADVFGRFTGPFGTPARFSEHPRDAAALATILAGRANQLTDAAMALQPAIAGVLAAIQASPGCLLARMSGSGATCFGIYPDEAGATTAAGWLRERLGNAWVAPSVLVG
jgi:4-diphosphocytidyl-2-C-methyl-D-erythritol kinase